MVLALVIETLNHTLLAPYLIQFLAHEYKADKRKMRKYIEVSDEAADPAMRRATREQRQEKLEERERSEARRVRGGEL